MLQPFTLIQNIILTQCNEYSIVILQTLTKDWKFQMLVGLIVASCFTVSGFLWWVNTMADTTEWTPAQKDNGVFINLALFASALMSITLGYVWYIAEIELNPFYLVFSAVVILFAVVILAGIFSITIRLLRNEFRKDTTS